MRAVRLFLATCALGAALTNTEAQPLRRPTVPELVKEVPPVYTPEARAAGIEGRVLLTAEVLTDGTVGEVQIVKSLDKKYGLDQEAVKAMKWWLFKPARKDGKPDGEPVSMVIHIDMGFSLKKNK